MGGSMTKDEALNWKNTELYRQGVFHSRLGKLLMNPKTRIDDISKLAFDYNMNPAFIFKAIDSMEEKKDEVSHD